MHTRAPCHGRQAVVEAVVVVVAVVAVVAAEAVVPVVPVAEAAAAVAEAAAAVAAAAGLSGVAGSVENSIPAGAVVVRALGRCPGATVSTRRAPKGLSRADLFASMSIRGQARVGAAFLQVTVFSDIHDIGICFVGADHLRVIIFNRVPGSSRAGRCVCAGGCFFFRPAGE